MNATLIAFKNGQAIVSPLNESDVSELRISLIEAGGRAGTIASPHGAIDVVAGHRDGAIDILVIERCDD